MPPRRLVVAAALAAASVWSGSALAATAPPINTSLPTVSVTRPQAGGTASGTIGSWTGAGSFTYQWETCDVRGADCQDIAGATGTTYAITSVAAGRTLVLQVTAWSGDRTVSTPAESDPSTVIAAFTLTTDHFAVHYVSDPASAASITQTQAGDIGADAERAYAAETDAGYPAPLSDNGRGGDSRIDVYVQAVDPASGVLGYAQPEFPTARQTSGFVVLNAALSAAGSLGQESIAHELFHLVQFGLWYPPLVSDRWLLEGSAEWMGQRIGGFAGPFELGGWEMALDCRDPLGTSQCDLDSPYKDGGYSRWPFFEFLAERWSAGWLEQVFQQGAGGGSATEALERAIGAQGGSLTDVFNDWTTANMTGGYTVPGLQDLAPPTTATLATGTLASLNPKAKGAAAVTSGDLAPVKVNVNHLSARYLALQRGSSTTPDGPCYKATLELHVAMPSGLGARPTYWWPQRNPDGSKRDPQPLSIDGDTASITLPWDTCDWGALRGYLSLANPSTTRDGQTFTITGTLTVDPDAVATATPPPDPVSTGGAAVVDASGAGSSDAPRIQVLGPQTIHIAAGSRQLRLIVSASDTGSLQAALGSLTLGKAKLRAGSNDVRFALPRTAAGTKLAAAVASSLRLTALSPSGAAGATVVRRVAFDRAATVKAVRQ